LSINDGVAANAANFNAAFLSRTQDSATVGKVTLNNSSDVLSGTVISNTQQAINELFDADGTNGENDTARKDYASTNYVTNGSSRKAAIEQLDTALYTVATTLMAGSGEPEVETFLLSAGDITNGYVTLASNPISSASTFLDVKGYPPQFLSDDYSVALNVVSWTGLGLDGVLVAGDIVRVKYWILPSPQVETFILSPGDIAAKQVTLTSTPATPTKTQLDVKGYPSQYYTDDYVVTGNILDWTGLALDGLLIAGDKIRVVYWL
jgi:hypothetical protein